MSIQPSEQDKARFRRDTQKRQVEQISGLTYKMRSTIERALDQLAEECPDDDMLTVTERIIRFLIILK